MKWVRMLSYLTVLVLIVMPSYGVPAADEGDPTAKSADVVTGGAQPAPRVPEDALYEGFEGGVVPPVDWTVLQMNPNETWGINDWSPHTGTYAAAVQYDPALLDQNEILLSPAFSASDGYVDLWSLGSLYWCRDDYDNCDLEVWFVKGAWGGGDDVFLGLADDDWPATWEWAESTFDFSAYADGSPARIAFRYVGNDGAEISVDDIIINYTPAVCNDPHEPNDSMGTATAIGYGTTVADADICPAGDEDYYVFSGNAGDPIVADIDAETLGSTLDSYLYLLDSSGSTLAYNDDWDGYDSHIEYTLPAGGTYYLRVREYSASEGGPDYYYTLSLQGPSFDVNSNWAGSAPSVDGSIGTAEWADAAVYDITNVAGMMQLGEGELTLSTAAPDQGSQPDGSRAPVTLYVKNDGTHLYLAFDNPNDTAYNAVDEAGIYFDDNPLPSDGLWTNTTCGNPDGEGSFFVRADGLDTYREIVAGPTFCGTLAAPGLDGTVGYSSGHVQLEAAIDLTSSALRASPGDSIGMYLFVYDGNDGSLDGQWPIGVVWDDPSTYGSLNLASGCADPHEPNDSMGTATAIGYGVTVADADICPAGDLDYYVFSGNAGDPIVADIDAWSLGSWLDSYLYLLDSSGTVLASNDDYDGLDSHIEYTLPAGGTYYLRVREYSASAGGPDYYYTLSLDRPSFDIDSNWAGSAPSVDGSIGTAEWADAAVYDITNPAGMMQLGDGELILSTAAPEQGSQPDGSRAPVTLYVKNDGTHLYLAFDNPNDTVYNDYDEVGVYFDDNPLPSDGMWTNTTCGNPDGEGNFWVDADGSNIYREFIAGPSTCTWVEPAPGLDGTWGYSSGHAQAEVAIDLTSSALRASPGDSIGMHMWILDSDTGVFDGEWPIGALFTDPSTYGSLNLASGGGEAAWTWLVYLDGDNNLESDGIEDFLEMSSVGSNSNVNIVVQMDRIPGYSTSYDDWTSTKRFLVTPGMTPTAGNALQDIGEANMGDPATLVDFVQWGIGAYPAEHYAVVIWDHGSGWRPGELVEPPVKDVAYDNTSGGDALDMPELRGAMDTLSGGGADPLDLVGFDACLMAMIEVDRQLIPYASVRVGSEETEPLNGWPYDDILSALVSSPGMSASQLGTVIVDEYYASYGNSQTQSAVDLGSAYGTLVGAVDDFAVALMGGIPTYCTEMAVARSSTQEFHTASYIDLYDFAYRINQQVSDATINNAATAVMNAVGNAVIREQHGGSWPGAHGISIYFPESEGSYNTLYNGSQSWLVFTVDTQWDEWLNAFYDCSTGCSDPHEPNDSLAQATAISYGQTVADAEICPAGDEDYYVFSGSTGDAIVADIDAQSLGSALDSYLYLLDSYGSVLAYNDDFGSLDSQIEYTLPADGTYYLRVREYNHPNEGGPEYSYTLSLELSPGFDVDSNWTGSPPSVDGSIGTAEWADAAVYDITASASVVRIEDGEVNLGTAAPGQASEPDGSRAPVTLYVKNDGTHLYLAFDNPNDAVYDDYDQAGIYFDDNPLPSDGQWTNTACGNPDGEGNFWVLADGSDIYREIVAGPTYCDLVDPALGLDGALQFTSGHAQAEVAIDLTSSALRAAPGDSIGMYLWIHDVNTGVNDGVWPIGADFGNPSTYGSLALATGSVEPEIEVTPTSFEVTLAPGQTTQRTMTIRNRGQGTLSFQLSERDVPWLSEDPTSGTVPAGGSSQVDVTFDATGLSVGTYTADIVIDNNDPDENPVIVPVILHVSEVNPVIVTIGDGSGSPGSTDNPVMISADNQSLNQTPIAAGEFRVIYDGSTGLTLVDVNTTARSADFMAGWTLDDSVPTAVEAHILLYSLSGATIGPGTGPILELLFDVDAGAQPGDSSPLSFSEVALSDQGANPIPVDFTDTGQFTLGCAKDGDINDDGETNIFDLQILVNMILHWPQPDPTLYPSDWWCRGDLAPPPNGDGQWNVFDLQRLVCSILGTCDRDAGVDAPSGEDNVVSIGAVHASPGTSGAFEIDLDNVDPVSAVEMWFTYNSTIGLEISDMATASRTAGWSVSFSKDDSDPLSVEIHVLLYNASGWSIDQGTGAILTVQYDTEEGASGESSLDVEQVNLSDAVGQPILAKWEDGTFRINEMIYLPIALR